MTRHKKMQMLLSILVCDTMEKDAEKTVNCGVFEGESLLLRIFYTKNVVIQNKHITCVA